MSDLDYPEGAIQWVEDEGIAQVEGQMKRALEWLEAKEMLERQEAALLEELGSYDRLNKYALDQRRVNHARKVTNDQ